MIRFRLMRGISVCFLSCAAVLILEGSGTAGLYDDARVAVPFLSVGTGARASAMGEAFSPVADDASALYWNPAGLARVEEFEAQFSHNQWLSDLKHECFGAALPFSGTLAVSWSLVDLGDFDELDDAGAFTGNRFRVNDQIYTVGYGRGFLRDTLLLGASMKMIQEDLGDGIIDNATVLDVGSLVVPWNALPNVSVSTVIQNIPTGGALSGFRIPLTLRLGAAWRKEGVLREPVDAPGEDLGNVGAERYLPEAGVSARARGDALILAGEIVVPSEGRAEVHAGMEYWWLSAAALRAGYRFRFPRNELGGLSGLTLGAGLRSHGVQVDYGFDYSYAPYGELGDASRFSLLVAF